MRYSTKGWLIVGAVVIAIEAVAPEGELLSERVDDWLISHPRATKFAICTVAIHLLNILDGLGLRRLDPLTLLHLALARLMTALNQVGVRTDSATSTV